MASADAAAAFSSDFYSGSTGAPFAPYLTTEFSASTDRCVCGGLSDLEEIHLCTSISEFFEGTDVCDFSTVPNPIFLPQAFGPTLSEFDIDRASRAPRDCGPAVLETGFDQASRAFDRADQRVVGSKWEVLEFLRRAHDHLVRASAAGGSPGGLVRSRGWRGPRLCPHWDYVVSI